MTDAKPDESANENADNTPNLTWEETDPEQLQSASSVWVHLKSQDDDGNSPTFFEKGRYAEWVQDMQEVAEWEMENFARQEEERLAKQAAPKLHIVLMGCGIGSEDPGRNEYSSFDQFHEISNMLAEYAVCEVSKPNKHANVHDFEHRLETSFHTMIKTRTDK